jgi:hypothetical protein
MLALTYIGGLGQLTRDLMSIDPTAKLFGRWSPLDHLFLIALLCETSPRLRRFSESLVSQIDKWIELRPESEKPLLFTEWVMGLPNTSKADELLGSLGLSNRRLKPPQLNSARKECYLAFLSAIVLDERSRGISICEIERRWGITSLDGLDEGWRDTALWILAGHAAVFEIRSFYHHLRENCCADRDRIRETKHALGRMRHQCYCLLEQLKHASPLGPVLSDIRSSMRGHKGPVVGLGTIRKLEEAGIGSPERLVQMKISDLEMLGVARRFANQIVSYSQRRLKRELL